MRWISGRPALVRAASSTTIALLLFSTGLLVLAFIRGRGNPRLPELLGFVSALWILGWPLGIARLMWKRRGVTSDGSSVLAATPDASSARLAMAGVVLFGLSVLVTGGALVRSVVPVAEENQRRDPREPPVLPESFSASTSREALVAELALDEVWTTTHPEYEGEIRILISSAPVEGMSPNYRGAFYHRDGGAFVRIGKGFGFGGYYPPELGRHPTLDVPAVVCLAEAIPEHTYFFVHEGVLQTFQENGDTWTPVERPQ